MSSLLLDFLKQDLDPKLRAQLDSNESLKTDAVKYLDDLLVNEQLLTPERFSSSSVPVEGKTTIIEEIAELDSRARQIDDQLAKVANENRDLLVGVSQDLKTVSFKLGSEIDTEIGAILSNINSLHYRKNAPLKAKAVEELAMSTSVLFDIDPILDILELPTLCKLCISQGNYQEALEISVMVKMLIIKFPSIHTFRKIAENVRIELQAMVKGLIKLLNTNLKQSNILKIFQILNRPDLIDFTDGSNKEKTSSRSIENSASRERFLKSIYLNSRFKFITNELAALKPLLKLKKVTYLKRCIETYREHLANSLSIYHAIFHSVSALKHEGENENTFLEYAFVKKLATILAKELREHFTGIGGGNNEDDSDTKSQKDGVVLQLVYLCKSLDKYGLNFESMLTWELCLVEPTLVSQEDWARNVGKVKKFRS